MSHCDRCYVTFFFSFLSLAFIYACIVESCTNIDWKFGTNKGHKTRISAPPLVEKKAILVVYFLCY